MFIHVTIRVYRQLQTYTVTKTSPLIIARMCANNSRTSIGHKSSTCMTFHR